jgi:hypothetical protein
VECKRTTKAVGVGQTFGQILAYKVMILEAGEKFLEEPYVLHPIVGFK